MIFNGHRKNTCNLFTRCRNCVLTFTVLVIFLALVFPSSLFAQTPDATEVLRSTRPILAGDRLRISVEEAPDINGIYAVAGDGTIDITFLGRVVIESQTTEEAGKYIAKLLENTYFKRATVQVEVSEFVEGSILVLGAVMHPGSLPYKGDEIITLIELLAQVGGMTERAARDQVKIFRWKLGGAMEREVITVNVKDIMTNLDFSKDQYLRPRDIVFVPELGDEGGQSEFLALGEFNNPGFYPYFENMDMIRAVVQAGGFTREAQMEMGRILRPDGAGNYTMIPVDISRLFGAADMKQNVPIYGGDIIFLPSSQHVAGGKVYFLGEIGQPGMFALPVSGDKTLARIILLRGGFTKFSDSSKVKVIRKDPNGLQQTLIFNVGDILERGNFDKDIPLQDEDVIIVPGKMFLF